MIAIVIFQSVTIVVISIIDFIRNKKNKTINSLNDKVIIEQFKLIEQLEKSVKNFTLEKKVFSESIFTVIKPQLILMEKYELLIELENILKKNDQK